MNENIIPIGIILTAATFIIMIAYRTACKDFLKTIKDTEDE